eukprot:gene25863-11534_t
MEKARDVWKSKATEVAALKPTGSGIVPKPPGPALPRPQAKPPTALDSLAQEIDGAPRYGLNARALILKAAAGVASMEGKMARLEKPTQALAADGPADWRPPRPRLNGPGLSEAVPLAERPFVTYVNRSQIPRLQRQACCNTLFSGYLVFLAEAIGVLDDKSAVQLVTGDVDVKKTASAAAISQENGIYRQVTGKAQYEVLARKAVADGQKYIEPDQAKPFFLVNSAKDQAKPFSLVNSAKDQAKPFFLVNSAKDLAKPFFLVNSAKDQAKPSHSSWSNLPKITFLRMPYM